MSHQRTARGPPYSTYDTFLKPRQPRTLEQSLQPLTLEQVLALRRRGAKLLDTRGPAEFESRHLHGSVNVGLDRSYETLCGTDLDQQRPIVVMAGPTREIEAVKRLVLPSTLSPVISAVGSTEPRPSAGP